MSNPFASLGGSSEDEVEEPEPAPVAKTVKPKAKQQPAKASGEEAVHDDKGPGADVGDKSYEVAEESSEDEGDQYTLEEYEAMKAAEKKALPTLTKGGGTRTVTADDNLEVLKKDDGEETLGGKGGKSKKGKNKNQRGSANVDLNSFLGKDAVIREAPREGESRGGRGGDGRGRGRGRGGGFRGGRGEGRGEGRGAFRGGRGDGSGRGRGRGGDRGRGRGRGRGDRGRGGPRGGGRGGPRGGPRGGFNAASPANDFPALA